jgi:hypothetical protein
MSQVAAFPGQAAETGAAWPGCIAACIGLHSGALASLALAGQIETTAEMRRTAQPGMARMAEIASLAPRR